MYKLLSYIIDEDNPGWPGMYKMEYSPHNLIKDGDGFNAYNIKIFNHFCTHIDAPNHFLEHGKTISEIDVADLVFTKPLLLDIPKKPRELIYKDDLKRYEKEIKDSDILLIKTGNCLKREINPEEYVYEGSGFSGEAGKYLVENFNNLKAIALDTISLAAHTNVQEGVKAHEYLLGKYTDNFILIIEDANFSKLNKEDKINEIICLPLLVKDIDSSPVTMIANVDVV